MKATLIRAIDQLFRIGLFVLAFGLVVVFLLAIDEFVIKQRLFFLRTGNWEDLLVVTAFGLIIAFVLKRLLVLQYQWGFKR
ncbi:MAG: hypothetical protein AABW68_02235 [archaeon]